METTYPFWHSTWVFPCSRWGPVPNSGAPRSGPNSVPSCHATCWDGGNPTPATMTSLWTRSRLKSPAPRLFTQPFIQGADQRKHQSSASLAFVRGIHRSPVNSPHKEPVARKMFPFDYVIISNRNFTLHFISFYLNFFSQNWSCRITTTGGQPKKWMLEEHEAVTALHFVSDVVVIYMGKLER